MARSEEMMTETNWTAPEACEICVGMEVTAYISAEI
jgi:coenzyme PQQ precursor peptide PqqA